jgi:hypothetical protein
MSFLRAFISAVIWSVVCAYLMSKGATMSPDTQFISLAIVIAGALAGGDKE